ncbi:MAG: hypothetical protein WCL70_12380 [Paludibacter sp.]
MFHEHNDYDNPHDKLDKMPLYQKGQEITELVRSIASLIEDEEGELGYTKQLMLEDAYMLCAKIAAAEGGDLYDIRMENAALIRRAAHSLKLHIHSLRMFGFEHAEYYMMVRDKVEEYRLLFIDWVAGFDKTNYIADRWGLFNPPGVSHDENDDEGGFDPGRFGDFFEDDDE